MSDKEVRHECQSKMNSHHFMEVINHSYNYRIIKFYNIYFFIKSLITQKHVSTSRFFPLSARERRRDDIGSEISVVDQ